LSPSACFDQRLAEALTIPGERIAFSTYPLTWRFNGTAYPTDTYIKVTNATSRKIWISETGWAAVPVRLGYQHGGVGSCSTEIVPAFTTDDENTNYLSWLLGEATDRGFETVIWWLNRDYLDGTIAATCPCSPASETCTLTNTFHTLGGVEAEFALRVFGNMALRKHDGSARPGHATWQNYMARPRVP